MLGRARHSWGRLGALIVLAALVTGTPTSVLASRLISATVGSRAKNSSLVVLQFDTPVNLNLQSASGREYVLSGGNIEERSLSSGSRGLVRSISIREGQIHIATTLYTHARLTGAGSGTYLLVLEPAKEPERPAEVRQAAPETTREQPPAEQPQEQVRQPESQPMTPAETPQTTQEETPQTQGMTGGYDATQMQSMPVSPGMAGPQVTPFLDLFEFVPIEAIQLPTTVKFALDISQQGNRDRAVVLLESVRPDEPEYGWAQIALGRLKDQAGDVSAALDNYRQALSVRETEGVAAVRIALAFQAMGNRDAAAAMWERVLNMNQGEVYVDPSEMPRAPLYRAPEPFAQSMEQPKQDEGMGDSSEMMEEKGEAKVSGEQMLKPKRYAAGREVASKALSFLRFWPYVVGGLALLAGLFFGLSYIQKKHHEEAQDLSKDLEAMGLDLEMTDKMRADTATPRVAQMYADQQDQDVIDDTDDEDADKLVSSHEDLVEDDEPGELEVSSDESIQLDEEQEEPTAGPSEGAPSDEFEEDGDEAALSEIKKAKIREMHAEGSSVREIAESLGLGQDEVRMTIDLAESTG